MLSYFIATLSSKCPVGLALMLRTSEPSIGHGHICCVYSTHQSQGLYHQAVIEDLHNINGCCADLEGAQHISLPIDGVL